MRGISISANDSLVLTKNVTVLSMKRRENANDHRSFNLLMDKRLYVTAGFILLLAFFRTTRTFSGHADRGEFKITRRVYLVFEQVKFIDFDLLCTCGTPYALGGRFIIVVFVPFSLISRRVEFY